ncbi:MAG TPA: hypothetical protein VFV78_00030 [Vicinamibacterales bacterium]|nr:hypothetical protein [Vicinamibacterales bacterium]
MAATLGLLGCAATRLEHTWVKPNLQIQPIRSVVTIALTQNPQRRRAMEEALASQLRSEALMATSSYTTIPEDDIRAEDQVRSHLELGSYDAAIFLRVTDVTRQDVYVPGRTVAVPVYYQTLWGYYAYWRPIAYEPGYVERDSDVQVETEVYALPAGDLVYSAVSRTLNPTSSTDLVNEVGRAVARDLKDKGLILK